MTGYTGFHPTDVSKQSGNYLAVKIDFATGATVTASIGNRGPVDLTSDKYLVLRVEDTDLANRLVFTATKSGTTEAKSYDISELVLEEA